MSAADGEAPSARPEPPVAPVAPPAPLPLRELDKALAPVRRGVRYGLSTEQGLGDHLLAILARQLARAQLLALPAELEEHLSSMAERVSALASAPADRGLLAELNARLTRVDALLGLPLRDRIRAVRKPVQRDRPEPRPATSKQAKRAKAAEQPAGSATATATATPAPAPVPAPASWQGDLDAPLDASLDESLVHRLGAHGIEVVRDLLTQVPTGFERLEPVHGAGRGLPDGLVAVGGRVTGRVTRLHADGTHTPGVWLVGASPLLVWLPRGVAAPDFADGARVVLVGRAEAGGVTDAEPATADDGVVELASYGLDGVADREVRAAVAALEPGLVQLRDPVSPDVLKRLKLSALGLALSGAHRNRPAAVRRLAFDEALLVHLTVAYSRYNGTQERGLSHSLLHGMAGKVGQTLEIVLDDEQQRTLEDVKRDLRRSSPMRRLITGEVGAGKGRVAAMAMAMVAEGRAQVMVVASDAAEAEHRFLHTEPILREGGLVARHLTGEPSFAVRDALKRGEINVLFGSVDLLEGGLEFRRLGLVVAVERERFGRASVLHERLRAPRPDLLVLASVPTGPRVLLTAYPDHDVSVLKHMVRRPAAITVCTADARHEAYARVREGVSRGEQAVVAFPLVKGSDALDIREALRVVHALESDALEGVRVGLFHGAMGREERARAFDDLVHRRLDVLVATTLIEDGPVVPAVTRLVVEQADRVEQWRLHRLVGFLSRAAVQGEAVLVVGEQAEPDAEARVQRVISARDGFELTESLVKHLGVDRTVEPGGRPLPQLSWLDLDVERELLLDARVEAHRVLAADPGLRRGSHAQLAQEARGAFERFWPGATDPEHWQCPIPETLAPERRRRRRRRRRR